MLKRLDEFLATPRGALLILLVDLGIFALLAYAVYQNL